MNNRAPRGIQSVEFNGHFDESVFGIGLKLEYGRYAMSRGHYKSTVDDTTQTPVVFGAEVSGPVEVEHRVVGECDVYGVGKRKGQSELAAFVKVHVVDEMGLLGRVGQTTFLNLKMI